MKLNIKQRGKGEPVTKMISAKELEVVKELKRLEEEANKEKETNGKENIG